MKRYLLVLLIVAVIGCYYIFQSDKKQTPPLSTLTPTDTPVLLANFQKQYDITNSADVRVYAENLDGIRDLQFTPGRNLLASLTSQGKVVTVNHAGEAKIILTGLENPHGLAFYKGYLYVVQEEKLSRYQWNEQKLEATGEEVLFVLPKGGRHFTRSIVFDKTGKLYLSVGSTCDTCLENDERLASVLTANADGSDVHIAAKGLRNGVFLAVNPDSGDVWTADMGRDYLGDDAPGDEIDIVKEGKNYGWPYCYNNKVRDTVFQAANPFDCSKTEPPIYLIPAHSAPLGLTFINSPKFPLDWQGDLLVAYHGSWNRTVPDGYKVVHLKVKGNIITGSEDFITGFINKGQVTGRPVDLAFDSQGNLFISDDKAGVIYKLNFLHK